MIVSDPADDTEWIPCQLIVNRSRIMQPPLWPSIVPPLTAHNLRISARFDDHPWHGFSLYNPLWRSVGHRDCPR